MADGWRVAEVLFAGGVFVFAGVSVLIAYHQWDVANKTASAAKDSADAAKIAAQSAQTANQLSHQALVITESPYVYNNHFLLKPLKEGQRATITVEVENMGKLAAENFAEMANVEFRTSPPTAINMGAEEKLTELAPFVPRILTVSTNDPVNIDQLRAVRSGALTLFIYGLLRYQTGLVKGGLVITTFCASYNPQQGLELTGCDYAPKLILGGQTIEPPNPRVGP